MSVSVALVVLALAARAPSSAAQADDGRVSTAPETASGGDAGCICVWFYLCDREGYIITTGEKLIDPRLGEGSTQPECSIGEICCKLARSAQLNTATTEVPLYAPEDCGVRGVASNTLDARILPGDEGDGRTEFAEFPWMLALLRAQDTFVCGASLVHPQVAITAAHCVSSYRSQAPELKVRAGEWDTQNTDEPLPHQERQVARIVEHPGYRKVTLINDIALLLLDSPFELARNVRTLCLAQQGDAFDGSRCIATGWGRNAFGKKAPLQTTMRMIELPVVAHDTCQSKLRNTRLSSFFQLHESFVCAGGEPGKDTCEGDGGGPLFCPSPRDRTRYVQLGITSWGIGCGETDVPAAYTNVPSFTDWIISLLP